jgi:hypothetical protein
MHQGGSTGRELPYLAIGNEGGAVKPLSPLLIIGNTLIFYTAAHSHRPAMLQPLESLTLSIQVILPAPPLPNLVAK